MSFSIETLITLSNDCLVLTEAPIPSRMQEPTNVRENTPLLPPASSSSQSRDTGCCIML